MLEHKFALQIAAICQEDDLPLPEREYRFHGTRRWRFDFAWPAYKIAVEIEGGVWARGRHNRGKGFVQDCEKYNHAAALGWRVFRFPGGQVQNGDAAFFMESVLCAEQDG
jgi:very-short-patch-repair endonuclease